MKYYQLFITRYGLWILIINLTVLLCIFLAAIAVNISFVGVRAYALQSDFRPFYTGGLMLLHGVRYNLYSLPTQLLWQKHLVPQLTSTQQLMPFLNPPPVALLFAIFALVPFIPAYVLWLLCNSLLLLFLIIGTYRLFPQQTWVKKVFVALVITTYTPIISTIIQAQISYLITAVFFSSYILLQKKRDFLGGIVLSLLCLKPQYILLPLLFLLVKKHFRVCAGFFTGLFFFVLLSYIMIGMDGIKNYVVFLIEIAHGQGIRISHDAYPTIEGFLLTVTARRHTQQIWIFFVLIFSGICMYLCRKQAAIQSKEFMLQWAGVLITAVLISVHTNITDVSIFIVAGTLLIRWAKSQEHIRKTITYFLVFGGYLISFLSNVTFQLYHIHIIVPYACFVLFALALMSARVVTPNSKKHVLFKVVENIFNKRHVSLPAKMGSLEEKKQVLE